MLKKVQQSFPGAELLPPVTPIEDRAYSVPGPTGHATVTLHVPCRKCGPCLRKRAFLWRQRSKVETAATHLRGARTWFGTLTCRPDVHHSHLAEARRRLDAQGIDFEGLSAEDQFRERHRSLSREATLWLKRVRKRTSASFRYLLVTEVHKSGLPHMHILVHEQDACKLIGERDLRETWPHGHTKFKLANEVAQAAYLCKYLSKDARARVRASARYGSNNGLQP